MPDHRADVLVTGRRRSPALLPAVLFSLTAHAAAGTLLDHQSRWQAPIESPQPLTVTLETAIPLPEVAALPPPIPQPAKPVVSRRVMPSPPVHQPVVPSQIGVERVDAAAPIVALAPEISPTPVVVAKAPKAPAAPGPAEAVEPPHFDVAYLNNPRPAYPPIARKLGLEGLVVLRVQVNARGAPEQVAVAQTSGTSVLDDAALRAVQGWTFVPARRGETPIAHVVEVPVRFQLKD